MTRPSYGLYAIFVPASVCLWLLLLYGDVVGILERTLLCIPILLSALYMSWSYRRLAIRTMQQQIRALRRDAERQDRISELQDCFYDTIIAMDLGLSRCAHLADPQNVELMREIEYLQRGLREVKEKTLTPPGRDSWLAPLV